MAIRTISMDIILKVICTREVHVLNLKNCSIIAHTATSIEFVFPGSSIRFNFRNTQIAATAYSSLDKILIGESRTYEWSIDATVELRRE